MVDIEAGKKTHLKTVLVLGGKTALAAVNDWKAKPDFIFKDLLEAVNFILGKEPR